MVINSKLLDELLADYKKPEDIIGENGLLKQLTKAVLERALNAEPTEHVGYEKHDPAGYNSGNSRNGTTKKTLKGEFGEMERASESPKAKMYNSWEHPLLNTTHGGPAIIRAACAAAISQGGVWRRDKREGGMEFCAGGPVRGLAEAVFACRSWVPALPAGG
jgi:putative transposase